MKRRNRKRGRMRKKNDEIVKKKETVKLKR
jgi:hypothetical protein